MSRPRRWRRRGRRGISEIIGAILLIALTLVAGVLLWTFHIRTPPSPPSVLIAIKTGGSNPVWGDPTDCQPTGQWTYPLTAAELAGPSPGLWGDEWNNECYPPAASGNFSALNTSQIQIVAHSPTNILLTDINLTFVCNNATNKGGRTVLISGSLASMTWYPGSTTQPAADAPYLGYCGNFDAGGYGGGSYGTLYNRLGMFIPLDQNHTVLTNGDTFLLYIHNGGWPIDFQCVDQALYGCYTNGGLPSLDSDDYHGAPPWCFTTPGACTIYLTYTGNPTTLLAAIPVYSMAPPTV
ncbi:MAG TPA: archaellin/type IV pilin N-terminal domain-containing protein [Thermoplasmata archaeon]|nr:archaellin/type IV pilin N-terminal domain-containing protein [Thermoplasmata archaeon]